MHGWSGKILQVDLSNSTLTETSTGPYTEKYLGGRGLASRLYWENVPPEVNAFAPENCLILMNGPLVAAGTHGANRMAVAGKSPMTVPEGYCYGNIGGFFPAELKKAGWDGIIIRGRAPAPVYLYIEDDRVELRDSAWLWGQRAYRTGELLRQACGDKIRFLTTGPAGENLVRTAVAFASSESTCNGGYGAVMGSKNLKAIAVRGTGKPSVADPERLKKLNRDVLRINNHYLLELPPHLSPTRQAKLLKYTGKRGCYQCALACAGGRFIYDGRLEGQRRCQSQEYYLPWYYGREDEPLDTLFDAPTLANDYSLGTFELTDTLEWLYSCYKEGILTEASTGLPLSRMGTREFLDTFLHAIAYREGFGDVLAEGLAGIKASVSPEAWALYSPLAAPIGQMEMISPRAMVVHGLLYPMEPRVSQPMIHETAYLFSGWRYHLKDPASPIDNKVFQACAKAFWGSEEAGDMPSYDGKALAAHKIQNRTFIKDSLGLCDFAWSIDYSFTTPDHVADPALSSAIFEAITGVAAGELDTCAERIVNQQRAILLREGRKVPEADYPMEMNFTEPLGSNPASGRVMLVPGPGDTVVDTAGLMLDRDRFTSLLKEYYRLRGWDEATGLPAPETLASLGLQDLETALRRP